MNRKVAFSLVEMLMALLVASLLMVAMAPVMTKKFNERVNVDGTWQLGGAKKTHEILFNSEECPDVKVDVDGSVYCEGEFVVPEGYNGVMKVTAIGGGGGGGTAPTAGYAEYTNAGTTANFTVPIMTGKIETTLVGGGDGGQAGKQIYTTQTFTNNGSANYTSAGGDVNLIETKNTGFGIWTVPQALKGRKAVVTGCGGGGGGGSMSQYYTSDYYIGYGGGSGGFVTKITDMPNVDKLSYFIGGGGAGSDRVYLDQTISYSRLPGSVGGGGGTSDSGTAYLTVFGGGYGSVGRNGGPAPIIENCGVASPNEYVEWGWGKGQHILLRGGSGGVQGGGGGASIHWHGHGGGGSGGGGGATLITAELSEVKDLTSSTKKYFTAPGGGGGASQRTNPGVQRINWTTEEWTITDDYTWASGGGGCYYDYDSSALSCASGGGGGGPTYIASNSHIHFMVSGGGGGGASNSHSPGVAGGGGGGGKDGGGGGSGGNWSISAYAVGGSGAGSGLSGGNSGACEALEGYYVCDNNGHTFLPRYGGAGGGGGPNGKSGTSWHSDGRDPETGGEINQTPGVGGRLTTNIFGNDNYCSGGDAREDGKPGAARIAWNETSNALKCKYNAYSDGSSGGGGGQVWIGEIDVNPGQLLNFKIGEGGNIQNAYSSDGYDGETTYIQISGGAKIVEVAGGKGGKATNGTSVGGTGGGKLLASWNDWTNKNASSSGGQSGSLASSHNGGKGGGVYKMDGTIASGANGGLTEREGENASNYGTGGGGGGGVSNYGTYPGKGGAGANGYIYIEWHGNNGGGGGSGQVVNGKTVWVTPGSKIKIYPGVGGAAKELTEIKDSEDNLDALKGEDGNNGGESYIVVDGEIKALANGGLGGKAGFIHHGTGGGIKTDASGNYDVNKIENELENSVYGQSGIDGYGGYGGTLTEELCPLLSEIKRFGVSMGGCGGMTSSSGQCFGSSLNGEGIAGTGIGSGGGGGAVYADGINKTAKKGGNGAKGVVVIEWGE